MTKPDDDEAIRAVRAAREAISAEHGDDPRRLVEHYMALQRRHRDRLLDAEAARRDDPQRGASGAA